MTLEDLADRLDALSREDLHRAVRAALTETGLDAQGRAQDRVSGGVLRVRSGRLRASIAATVRDAAGGAEMALGAGGRSGGRDVVYARIQELGGTITPKRGKFLAIPIEGGPAMTAAGVARYASPRDVPGLRFVPTRGGAGGLLVKDIPGSKRKGERSELWYRLVRRVTIRPKHYLRDSMAEAAPSLRDRLSQHIASALESP